MIMHICDVYAKLQRLSSYRLYYKLFNDGDTENCDNPDDSVQGLVSKLQSNFQGCGDIITDATKIAHAYCYACTQNGLGTFGDVPCYFFYYWLGDKYGKNLVDKNLSDLLGDIYSTFKVSSRRKKCNVTYTNVNKNLLPQMKKVYEYYYEHDTINAGLLKSWPNCEKQWLEYLKEVSIACKNLESVCTAEESPIAGSYCSVFKNKYRSHCNTAEALNFYCTEKSKLEQLKTDKQRAERQAQSTQSQLNEALNKANKASSLSSAFGTLALLELPALLFLAYKYKPWSSWFGIHSGGRRKSRKRRTAVESDFDTLREASTTDSVLDASENSTVGSGAYNTRPSTGGRERANNNTRGRGMVGYQNM
ncbi:KIR-like protein [Plasmodium coatneyi]|uniref:KIR-like protein n=1 Tax=Plasmodium coatneyi TaxID=208452 RepID=A0A1B1E7F6_9APIC|nr:KIR-like protein [Plasmodium coatneyi]ANQ10956.1 KIR-like protein [Plasmodium coatneyi]